MAFDFRTAYRMFRRAFQEDMSPRRRKVVWILLFLFPTVSALNGLCMYLDHVFFPRFRNIPVRAPVFLIGHSRSGTSLSHRLFSRDAQRFSYFRTYELFLPSILQKKFIRWLSRMDRRHWNNTIHRKVEAWEDRAFAKGREMHPMSLTGPEEDDFLGTTSFISGTPILFFPYMREFNFLYYYDERPAHERKRWSRYYRRCIQRQLYLNGEERIHCCKAPTYSGRVQTLIDEFPDARFVVLMRNPYETIPSLMKMMDRNWRASGVDRELIHDNLDAMYGQSLHTYGYVFDVLKNKGRNPLAVMEYPELLEHPKKSVENAYATLGFDVSAEFSAALDEEQQHARTHQADHRYSLEEYGIDRDDIRNKLAPLFERFGWSPGAPTD